jgi:hypothetical protein
MDDQSRSARSKPLTERDCIVLAEALGFVSVSDFIKFAAAQQDKADHPERVELVPASEKHLVIRPPRPSMVYGGGRA